MSSLTVEQAIAQFQESIALEPGDLMAYEHLATTLRINGRPEEAIALYQRAIAQQPGAAWIHNNLGSVFNEMGRTEEALVAYRQALALDRSAVYVYWNIGGILRDLGQLEEALTICQQGLAVDADAAQLHNTLGNVYMAMGRVDQALAAFRRAITLQPDLAQAHSDMVYAMHFHPGYDAAAILQAHRQWSQQHAEPLKRWHRPHGNDRSPNRRLRIGYVSPDLRNHVVGRFLLPLLACHDHQRFEIVCYCDARQAPDDMTHQLRSHADQWRNIRQLSNQQAAELVRQDGIDILVDLFMHLGGDRLLLFAYKPAPVQATYLAYCSTTGLDSIDYRLTDPYLDPPGQTDQFYTEQSIRLPETYWCYQAPPEAPEPGPLPALSTGLITFGCLNNFRKVSPPALAAWCDILGAVPRSRLLLHANEGTFRRDVLNYLASRGIDPQRLSFAGFAQMAEYLRLYCQIDIALDPFPHAGGTTTCDALWMGTPVITLRGQTGVGRGGVSILSNLGLTDLIAANGDSYVRLAGELAGDLSRLGELRAGLRQRMRCSPLMDAPRFARNVEAAYRRMWIGKMG